MLKLLRTLILMPLLGAGIALSAEFPFDTARFDALNQEGKPILIAVHADWCPTCKAQQPIVSELMTTPALKGITAFRVDFDGQKDVVKRFKATTQSTLIVFKGGKEVGRSVGDTRKDSIAALLKKAI
ncbi:MAG: thiol reductase thioredoxin [Rhodocyclales bacterium GWA2_65_19]|nr:MAG: thiol reductase thioredoxin [Rhodocyclales bacterium GWA2_65_19]